MFQREGIQVKRDVSPAHVFRAGWPRTLTAGHCGFVIVL